jgi:hypothetical protein
MASAVYSSVRGFNYQPSYASHGLDIWGDRFDVAVFDREIGFGKRHFPKMNTVRLWLSHDAFVRNADQMIDNFRSVLPLAEKHGVRWIVTLFNGWHSIPDFGGISPEQINWFGTHAFELYRTYVDRVVGPCVNDDRVLLWDLCNEPFNSAPSGDAEARVYNWLSQLYDECKALGAKAPICVGTVPLLDAIKRIEPISDVLTFHPYLALNAFVPSVAEFEQFLDGVVAFAASVGKPLVATETGWGSLDDAARVASLEIELGSLAKRGIGFTAHLLHETLVADGHRPQYGPVTIAGYMAFVNRDGSLRAGHDVFNRF